MLYGNHESTWSPAEIQCARGRTQQTRGTVKTREYEHVWRSDVSIMRETPSITRSNKLNWFVLQLHSLIEKLIYRTIVWNVKWHGSDSKGVFPAVPALHFVINFLLKLNIQKQIQFPTNITICSRGLERET